MQAIDQIKKRNKKEIKKITKISKKFPSFFEGNLY